LSGQPGSDEPKNEQLENKMASVYTKFLKSLQKAQPLIVMTSVSMIIATFSGGKFQTAQPYAVTAAVMFLVAFLCSILYLNLLSVWQLQALSLTFILSGIAFLSLTVYEFVKNAVFIAVAFEKTLEVFILAALVLFPMASLLRYIQIVPNTVQLWLISRKTDELRKIFKPVFKMSAIYSLIVVIACIGIFSIIIYLTFSVLSLIVPLFVARYKPLIYFCFCLGFICFVCVVLGSLAAVKFTKKWARDVLEELLSYRDKILKIIEKYKDKTT